MLPLVTIITITRNSAKTIRETMASVLSQDYNNIEYLIIDSLSTDSTVEIAKSFQDPRISVVSEKDSGISNAMNKGIRLARGEIIGIIHSDDFYCENAISSAVTSILKTGADWVYGQIEYIDELNRSLYVSGRPFCLRQLKRYMMIPHPSVFMRKQVYVDLGGFNERYSLAMDYELCLRVALQRTPTYIPRVLARMRTGGASCSSLQAELRVADEVLKIKRELLNNTCFAQVYSFWTKSKIVVRRTLNHLPILRNLVPYCRKLVNPNFIDSQRI